MGFGDLNPPDVRDPSFPDRFRDELGWYVTWIGIEA